MDQDLSVKIVTHNTEKDGKEEIVDGKEEMVSWKNYWN